MSDNAVLAELPVPSTSFDPDTTFQDSGGEVVLRFRYPRDGLRFAGGFRFSQVRGYRQRAEGHVTVWHLEAYDRLVEVAASEWIDELRAAQRSEWPTEIHHYMIYIDDAGSYEVAALAWERLPESRIE